MSLGSQERQARERRRLIWTVVRWGTAAIGVILAGAFAYKVGADLAAIDVRRLEYKISELQTANDTLNGEIGAHKATAAQAEQKAREWQSRYEAEMPAGDARTILDLARQKLAEGVGPERIIFLIGAAAKPQVCDAEPESKRFRIRTRIGKSGGNDTAVFADRAITVTALGEPMVNEQGQPEAWYDPAQPITVTVAELGGKSSDVTGALPLHHAVVIGASEYRFSFIADEKKGIAMATATRCDFP